jgi:hypothetical protein
MNTDYPSKTEYPEFNSATQLEVRESGIGEIPSPPIGELPPGQGLYAVPPHLTKISLINLIARSYRWTYDEALKHSRENAVAMLRDTEIREALETRFMQTVQLEWYLEPQDETDQKQVDAAKKITEVIKKTPYLQDLFKTLLWGIWFGRAGAALTYKYDYSHADKQRRTVVKNHYPINGDSLVARWNGEWGQKVYAGFPGTKEPTDLGYAHFYSPEELEAIIIHTHNKEDADFFEPELAGQIRGSGLRGHCYWFWWLAGNFLALAQDYAERFAWGIWTAGYDKTNPNGKLEMEDSLAGYKSDRVILVPKNPDGSTPYTVDVKEVGTATPTFIFEIVQWLRGIIKRYIIGSDLSEDSAMQIGGDGAGVLEDRISRVVKYDAERLAETLTYFWVPVLCKYNCGEHVPPPYFKFNVDRPNAGNLLNYALQLHQLGDDIDLDFLREAAGLPKTTPGSSVSSKLQPMSPTAVDAVPQNTVMIGQPGPIPDQMQQQQIPQPQQVVGQVPQQQAVPVQG